MAKNGAVFVFCSSCKILYFASSVHPRIATELCRKECSEYNDVGHEGLYLRPSRLIIITNKQENKALSPNAIMY